MHDRGHGPSPSAVADLIGARCGPCHGVDGRGRESPAFPRLAGQKAHYLRLALSAYAGGRRHSGTMTPVALALDAGTMSAIADHYAALPGTPSGPASPSTGRPAAPDTSVVRGAAIARLGIPAQGVPRCVECHGPAATKRNAAYPRLAGQFAPYLELQLQLFAERRRGGSPFAHLMQDVAAETDASPAPGRCRVVRVAARRRARSDREAARAATRPPRADYFLAW